MTVCPLCKSGLMSKNKILVCNRCRQSYPEIEGIMMMYPKQTRINKELINYYNKDYSKHTPSFHSEDSPPKAKEVLEMLPRSFKCNSLLDIGCGAGQISLRLKKHLGVKKIIFLDIALDAIKLIPKDKANEYYVGLAQNIPLENSSVDLTLALDLLEHTENPKKILKEISRCSRFLLVKSPLEKSFMRILLHKTMNIIYGRNYWKRIFGHIQQFNRKDLYNMLKEGGFKIKKQRLSIDIAESVRSPIFKFFLYIQKIAFTIMPKPIFERIFGGHLWVFAERE